MTEGRSSVTSIKQSIPRSISGISKLPYRDATDSPLSAATVSPVRHSPSVGAGISHSTSRSQNLAAYTRKMVPSPSSMFAGGGGGGGGGVGTTTQTRLPSVDVIKFADEGFQPQNFVHGILTSNSEDGVRGYHLALSDARDAAAADLQRNVYRNYNEFVLISKEISNLERDMMALRSWLAELKDANVGVRGDAEKPVDDALIVEEATTTIDGTTEDTSTSPNAPLLALAKKGNSEVWNRARVQQMQALYENVEGLMKSLTLLPPPLPGTTRFLVRSDNDAAKPRSTEINLTTFKPIKPVYFYVLSDALIVATKKKSLITGKNRMSVDKCWGLIDLAVVDVKDSADATNVFKVMKHPDVYLYRSDSVEEKRGLLAAIKRLTDDLMVQKRKQAETNVAPVDEEKTTNTPTPAQTASDAFFFTTPYSPHTKPTGPQKDDLSAADIKFLTDLPDELDVLIAHREFEKAVEFVEKASQVILTAITETQRVVHLRNAIEERTSHLANLISIDLANPVNNKGAVQANIDMLLRLKLGDQARDFFLTSRSVIIRHRIRLLRFDGDVATYINDLAELVFRLIRNTCDWYGSSFHDTTMASGFMKWVRQEVHNFGSIFRRQVFDSKQNFTTIADCLQGALERCRMLKEVGLDLTFVLDDLFHDDLVNAIDEHAKRCNGEIVGAVIEDGFGSVETGSEDGTWVSWKVGNVENEDLITKAWFVAEFPVKVSKSVHALYAILMDFGADMGLLMSIALYRKIVSALTDFFQAHVQQLLNVALSGLGLKQTAIILIDATFVVGDLMPKVTSQLAGRFERPIPELDDMRVKLEETVTQVRQAFVSSAKKKLIKDAYNFPTIDYSNSAAILDTIKPTEYIMKLLDQLNRLAQELDPTLDRKGILSAVVEGIFEFMSQDSCWESERGPRRIGFGGVQHLFLDIHFFLRTATHIVSPKTTDLANSTCERALRTYFLQNKDMVGGLKSGEWFDKRVEDVLKDVKGQFKGLLELG
ncbi:exocyst complex component exo84 [Rhizophlyctis rosea]|uniref:Exocyst complex component EXO84 n=1 Tax=Rhizophlyctis rosea TaxID=64517 RepID=A0AAD5S6E2_9FUNG|nr:exocyst complex component exo84 [Rhizophlyctis rosea]